MVDKTKLQAIVEWLVQGAPPPKSIDELLVDCATRLVDAGVPLEACVVNGIFVHPQIRAIRYSWTRDRGVRRRTFDHSFMKSPEFLETPLSAMIETQKSVRYKFIGSTCEPTSRFQMAYKSLGYTDVVIFPLVNVDGSATGNLEFSTKNTDGFTDEHMEALSKLRYPIARLKEYHTEHFDKRFTLESYVGYEPCKKILSGQVSRGDGEVVTAVILFADLSGFTQMADTSNYEEVLGTLNLFFEIIGKYISKYHGEILKFIGDGVLVVFNSSYSPAAQRVAAQCALATIEETRRELGDRFGGTRMNFKSSLHIGEIFLGNVGTLTRLDFTAIGPNVNLAARMLEVATQHNTAIVCSPAFKTLLKDIPTTPITTKLRGLSNKQDLFSIERYSIETTQRYDPDTTVRVDGSTLNDTPLG